MQVVEALDNRVIRLTVVLSLLVPLGISAAAHPIMRSLESRVQTQVTFENRTGKPILVFWVDYNGEEVLYRELAPDVTYVQPTYETHPWRVRDKLTGAEIKTIVAGSNPQAVVIAEAARTRTPRGKQKDGSASAPEDIRVRTRVDLETDAKFSLSKQQESSPHLRFHPAPKDDPCVWTLPHAVHVLVEVPADLDLADLSKANRLLEKGRDYALAECGQPTEGQKTWGAAIAVRLFQRRFDAANWEDGWAAFAYFLSFDSFKLRTDSRDYYANKPYAELRRRQEAERNRTKARIARETVSSNTPVAPRRGLIRWEDPIDKGVVVVWLLVWLTGAVWYGWSLRPIWTGSLPASSKLWASVWRALVVIVAPGLAVTVLVVAAILMLVGGLIYLVAHAAGEEEGSQDSEFWRGYRAGVKAKGPVEGVAEIFALPFQNREYRAGLKKGERDRWRGKVR